MPRRWPNAPGCWRAIPRCGRRREKMQQGRSPCAAGVGLRRGGSGGVFLLNTGKEQERGGVDPQANPLKIKTVREKPDAVMRQKFRPFRNYFNPNQISAFASSHRIAVN